MENKKMTLDDYVYSKEIYDGFQLFSQYVTMPDGIRIAIDIFRPTKNGVLHEEKLPVVWSITEHLRAKQLPDPPYRTMISDNTFFAAEDFDRLIYHGYVLAVADVRGTGASFGKRSQNLTLDDMNDFREINEWLAHQEWCDGKTGMFGSSYLGRVQYAALSMAPPSLKCIFPMVCELEYPTMVYNGMKNTGWMRYLDSANKANTVVNIAPPVDEDVDSKMLEAATEEHRKATSFSAERKKSPYMDSFNPEFNSRIYLTTYTPNFLHTINHSGVAVYMWGAIQDFQALGTFKWWSSLDVPKKMVVGNWVHTGQFLPEAPDYTLEHVRWYDYWLKGIDNGIMVEPPIMIQQTKIPVDDFELEWSKGLGHQIDNPYPCSRMKCESEWKCYNAFPVEEAEYKGFYFSGIKADSIDSVNDGSLYGERKLADNSEKDEYKVDYEVTRIGIFDRNMFQIRDAQIDSSDMDKKCLTYTSAPLASDAEIVGIPVMNLWADASVEYLDFYAYLEEVNPDGVSVQLAEGRIRSDFREKMDPPFNFNGLPWHRYFESDKKPMMPGEPTLFEFAMTPVSSLVVKGNRIRVTICNNDKGNWDTEVIEPAPVVHVYHGEGHESFMNLPLIKKVLNQ